MQRKPLEPRGFWPGLRLASAVLVLVCAQACLVPQSVDPIEVSPHPPPHFMLENIPSYLISPVLQLDRQGSLDTCRCEIEIPTLYVEEDDPTVDLEARWFIDYDPAVQRSEVIQRHDTGGPLAGTFNDPTYTKRQLNKFDFDADAYGVQNGVHVLEVMVGETAGFDDTVSAALPNRTMKAGFTAALYRFVINVNLQQITGSCVKVPSVPVCQ